MYLYLGGGRSIDAAELIGIFDMDSATIGQPTRAFLAAAQREGRISEALDPGDIPRAFTVTADGAVTLTETSAGQLSYRLKNPVRKR